MSSLGSNFYPKLVKISSEVGMKPEDLLAVMISESGLDPAAHETKYGASGLIQFMPSTLKQMNYKGTPAEFRSMLGEDQLEYIKRYIQSNSSINGGPFTSAAQYYVANFFPVALKLAGIKSGDPKTAFVEEKPETIKDPKSGELWSKKYFDVGIKLHPYSEISAYKANPLFHGSTPGAITYGDMLNQVEKNKRNPKYIKAIADMKAATGYQIDTKTVEKEDNSLGKFLERYKGKEDDVYSKFMKSTNPSEPESKNIDDVVDSYLKEISVANKKTYDKFLTNNTATIKIIANKIDAIEFSRILCSALDEELQSKSFTHYNGNNTEVECNIAGPHDECMNVVKEITNSVVEAFKIATNKLGGIEIKTQILIDKKSSYKPISLRTADVNYRKFLLKFF